MRRVSPIPKPTPTGSLARSGAERERQAGLILVLPLLGRVARLAHRLALVEEDLRDPLAGINLCRKRRRVGNLDRDAPAPLRLQGRDVHDDTATRVCAFAQADREDVSRD